MEFVITSKNINGVGERYWKLNSSWETLPEDFKSIEGKVQEDVLHFLTKYTGGKEGLVSHVKEFNTNEKVTVLKCAEKEDKNADIDKIGKAYDAFVEGTIGYEEFDSMLPEGMSEMVGYLGVSAEGSSKEYRIVYVNTKYIWLLEEGV